MATPALLGVTSALQRAKYHGACLVWKLGDRDCPNRILLVRAKWFPAPGVRFAIAALDAPIVPADNYDALVDASTRFTEGPSGIVVGPASVIISVSYPFRGLALRDAGCQAAQQFGCT